MSAVQDSSQTNSQSPDSKPRRGRGFYVALILLIASLGVGSWYAYRWKLDGDQRAARDQITAKNVAVGRLENQPNLDGEERTSNLTEASTAFESLADALSKEPLGPRNLAILHLIHARQIVADRVDKSQFPTEDVYHSALSETIRTAEDVLNQLQQIEGDAPLVARLRARLAMFIEDDERVVQELSAAVEKSPDDATLQYELFAYLDDAEKRPAPIDAVERAKVLAMRERLQPVATKAIQEAYRLRPQNLKVLVGMLQTQAAQKDPEILKTLADARRTLKPIVPLVELATQANLDDVVSDAVELVRKEAWAAADVGKNDPYVAGRIHTIRNLLISQQAWKIDERRIIPHELEFVLQDFNERFYKDADLPELESFPPIPVQFVEVEDAAITPDDGVAAVTSTDFDLDERVDVIVIDGRRLRVLSGGADGGKWATLAEHDVSDGVTGVIAVDLDDDVNDAARAVAATSSGKDGDRNAAQSKCRNAANIDVVAYGAEGVVILRSRFDASAKKRVLEKPESETGLEQLKNVTALAAGDWDHDGDLDLVTSSGKGVELWLNRGKFRFANYSDSSDLPSDDFQPTAIAPVDWDRNVALDFLLAGPGGRTGWLENLLHYSFRRQTFDTEFTEGSGGGDGSNGGESLALALVDADGNASWDFVEAGPNGLRLTLTNTPSPSVVRRHSATTIDEFPAEGVAAWDYDNDGCDDLAAWSTDEIRIYRGDPHGRFERIAEVAPVGVENILDCRPVDLDGDGDLDLLVSQTDRVRWFRNEGGNANHWITLRLSSERGLKDQSLRTNVYGLGSLVEMKAGRRYQARVVSGQTTHLGLGKLDRADVVRVLWTNGIPQNLIKPVASTAGDNMKWQAVCQNQRLLLGSCPYVYTWDGARFVFMTDLLWSSPIGLQFAEGVLAPAREWEYLRIPGEMLAARDGRYVMQFTEELWEAAYFDEVRLIAVDHPVDVDVYSNEKVGPAEIAEFKVHTARNPSTPVAAIDKHGRDVLETIEKRDGDYLRGYDARRMQGLTDEHYVELNLGDLDDPENIRLFLTGWMFPTDVNLNIALSQNPDLEPPRPPSILTLDKNGEWKTVIPYCGFPGGKTKTIVVDLSGKFPTDDHRVRVQTSMEIYWDEIFFISGESPAEFRLQPMPPVAADLHPRGFSKRIENTGWGPESYDYDTVSKQPFWPPMEGRFTRYGDVKNLMTESDDRLVVMGSGDEMTLEFAVPADPPPPGWKRDFLLYNVGWDKDAGMNTVAGRSSEPLPFRKMPAYPYPPNAAPDGPEYREYLERYQTRKQNPAAFWNQIRNANLR